jgi:Flp pilus assembly protein TadD/TolB-like protein
MVWTALRTPVQSSYNRDILRTLRLIAVLLVCFGSSFLFAENGTQTLLILPFENQSKAPGLEWISEAVPEVLSEGMTTGATYIVPRDDRNYAFDRMGVPTTTKLSRATLFRISEQMDADFVVLGAYTYDGQTFTVSAQLLDMKKLYLAPEVKESGPLVNMVSVQRALAWDLLRDLNPEAVASKQTFVADAPMIRLDAFESYIRGTLGNTRQEKIQRFREAVRLNPSYTQAAFQLGKTYYANREFESAASWFARVPSEDPLAPAANFFLGLSAFYSGNYERAETAFKFLEGRMPLPEVNNDLGVVMGRRGKRAELDYLQKASQADPNDPDYHFNLAIAYARLFDNANATRQLKEVLRLRPSDAEAKTFLDALNGSQGSTPSYSFRQASTATKLPLQRMKQNYDETSYRQLAMEIVRAAEGRLSKASPQEHAAFHAERGNQFLKQGFTQEAQAAYQEAIVLDPTSAAAHLGLAQAYEADAKDKEAVSEANAALRLKASAPALLILARQNLKDNKFSAASEEVERALVLEPANQDAQKLKDAITEKLAGTRN